MHQKAGVMLYTLCQHLEAIQKEKRKKNKKPTKNKKQLYLKVNKRNHVLEQFILLTQIKLLIGGVWKFPLSLSLVYGCGGSVCLKGFGLWPVCVCVLLEGKITMKR